MSKQMEQITREVEGWFARVEGLLGAKAEPEEAWAELWFDGYTPAEAIKEMAALDASESQP